MYQLIKCDNESPLQALIDKEEGIAYSSNYITYNHEATDVEFSNPENILITTDKKETEEIFNHICSIETLEFLAKRHARNKDYQTALYSSLDAALKLEEKIKILRKVKKEYCTLYPTKKEQKENSYNSFFSTTLRDNVVYSDVIGDLRILKKRLNDLKFGKNYYNLYTVKNEEFKKTVPQVPNVQKVMEKKATFDKDTFIFTPDNEPCVSVLEQEHRDGLFIGFITACYERAIEIIKVINTIQSKGLKWKEQDKLRELRITLIDYHYYNFNSDYTIQEYSMVKDLIDISIKL